MPQTEHLDTYAAVDLGSNSFHLLVARRSHGELRVLDRIKETVRLGGGLDRNGRLDEATRNLALECLARFGQRLRGIPDANIRAVGTQTFRRLKNANAFLVIVESALGCPVDIIAGREEARLIYLGVSQGVAGNDGRRLVIDIGGGSTELVIGEGFDPLELESLQFGCVSLTRWHFGNGMISERRFRKARRAVLSELQELQLRYRDLGWQTAIGSSGTVRAIASICEQQGWCERDITAAALARLESALLRFREIDDIDFPGMSERRKAVIAGGIVMLSACFEALGIERMKVSPFALREGVLHDLLGRLDHRDPRDKTVQAFRSRYGVDAAQAERVRKLAQAAMDQVSAPLALTAAHRQVLGWACELHETGLGISHSHYERHSGYLVAESDMAGFSRQEQLFLAALVRWHRRAISVDYAAQLPARLHGPVRKTLFLIRIAWILCRSREDAALPSLVLEVRDDTVRLSFPPGWGPAHPLTVADLEEERAEARKLGLALELDCH
ncbi:MAG: exopolyphosphatase [Xanthomonadales bacterium]|nr:exopolyphosphatase [Xanthomonadales bacterium]